MRAEFRKAEADEFINDVYNKLKVKYKVQNNGEILFRFPRLFFTAIK